MSIVLYIIKWYGIGIFAIAFAIMVYLLARVPLLMVPHYGHRGRQRHEMLNQSSTFRLIDPLVRLIASWISAVKFNIFKNRIERLLIEGGDYLGASPEEFIALSVLSLSTFAGFGSIMSVLINGNFMIIYSMIGALIGSVLPYLQLRSKVLYRVKETNRLLPATIDLVALCMNAGRDFPGALRLIVNGSTTHKDVVEIEMSRILQELDIGHTRKQALLEYQKRVPSQAVKEFVGAVIQADEKGTPLSEIFKIQARVQRTKRSVAAEEAAARAGILMMIPLFILLCCILMILLAPFIINGVGF